MLREFSPGIQDETFSSPKLVYQTRILNPEVQILQTFQIRSANFDRRKTRLIIRGHQLKIER